MRLSILTYLVLFLATAVSGLAIRQSSCASGSPEETLNFDSSSSSSLTLMGYTLSPASSSNNSIQGLKAHSSPNVVFTGAPSSEFPPSIAGSGFASVDTAKTFTVKSFYIGTTPGTSDQLLLIATRNGQTSASIKSGGTDQEGNMAFIDLSADTTGAYSSLSAFSIRAESSGFVKAHAVDDFTISWDC